VRLFDTNNSFCTRYSGDTMPTTKLVDAGKGSTVLIHEATLADDEADMALAKAHSTFGQALDIGKQ
jgi:ribonuclease Z